MLVALNDGRVIATNLAASPRQRSDSTGSNANADRAASSPTSPPAAVAPPPQSDDFQPQMLE